MTKIKVETEETPKQPKTVKLELTRMEMIQLAAVMARAQDVALAGVVSPGRNTRRALRRGKVTKDDLVEQYRTIRTINSKIATAIIGVKPEELAEEIRKFMEEE